MLDKIIEQYPDIEFLKADGLDDAIIGVDYQSYRLIYSIGACIEIIMSTHGLGYDDAMEYLEFNTFGAYMGDKTPIWCDDLFNVEI